MNENSPEDRAVGGQLPADHPLLNRRRLFKFTFAAGGALILGPGVLAACGSNDAGTGSGSASTPSEAAATSSDAGSPSVGSSAAATSGGGGGGSEGGGGGELTVGVVADISNFDPYYNGTPNFILLQNMNTFLLDYDDELTAHEAGLTAWKLNDDNTQITLTLRENVAMQSGSTWSAQDLVQGFERAADPDQGQQLNGPMSIVKSFKATDDNTVVLTFNSPVAELLVTDLLENFPVTTKATNNSDFFAAKGDGAGSFELKDRDPGNTVTLSRFADYWDAGAVSLDTLSFRIFDNADSMVTALQSGALDVIYRFPAKNAAQLKDQFTIIEGYPGALVDCVRMNINVAPFDNIKLRQAIGRALDRQRVVDEVYFGYGQPLFLPWGPNSPANDSSYAEKNSHDLDAAKKLWAEAGSPASGEAVADSSNAAALSILQILQQDLKSVGFDLQIKTLDSATFTERLLAGDFGLLMGGLGNTSKSPSRIATNSIFRIVDNPVLKDKTPQEYIDAIKASESATTPEAVQKAYAELNRVITEQAFGIPVCTNISLIATAKSVTGVTRDVDDRIVLKGAKKG
ncbi:ABC transporter substrate-binding protein [Nakamurella lactea]|uniref:ABC transporter substrate-binding protein n=1 Tax=Nakamurella lactea TaxID=459515 RepID=UPI0003FF9548|nr:ABC transporter substrate-binding protein [Nakamurella lactea]